MKYVQEKGYFLLFMLSVVLSELQKFVTSADVRRFLWGVFDQIEKPLVGPELRRLTMVYGDEVGNFRVPCILIPQFGV